MANPFKGEVAFDLDGKTYTLVLDFNVLADEDVDIADVGRPREMRLLWRAAMMRHQPATTLHEAGDIMRELGADEVGRLITEAAIAGGLASKKDGGDGEASQNPRQARRAAASISRKR
jgi:hypothetical protein